MASTKLKCSTLKELELICMTARSEGLTDDTPVKIYNNGNRIMAHTIQDLISFRIRKVQNYNTLGDSSRNKYLLLSATEHMPTSDT